MISPLAPLLESFSEPVARFHHQVTIEQFKQARAAIARELEARGITFEGQPIPVSLLPTVLSGVELDWVAHEARAVREGLLRVIQEFLAEHRRGELDGPLHQMFKPYEKWWDLIAAEQRSMTPIGFMRYDAIREARGVWQLLETNTACPSLTINCARSRAAWLGTAVGQALASAIKVREYPNDDPRGFAQFLAAKAETAARGRTPNLAICSFRGVYQNELVALQGAHRELVAEGKIQKAELVLCDIRELELVKGQVHARGVPVTLIHNKIDPLMIDPADAELTGWRAAARSDQVEFLNSLGAIYLTEAKRVLAVLSDAAWWPVLKLKKSTTDAIRSLVPLTRVLPTPGSPEAPQVYEAVRISQPNLVLKADALTRGQGIYLGSQMGLGDWAKRIDETAHANGVYQVAVNVPRRINYRLTTDGRREPYTEFYGTDLLFFDETFAGAVSRCHTDIIFNIGNGGAVSPTLVATSL